MPALFAYRFFLMLQGFVPREAHHLPGLCFHIFHLRQPPIYPTPCCAESLFDISAEFSTYSSSVLIVRLFIGPPMLPPVVQNPYSSSPQKFHLSGLLFSKSYSPSPQRVPLNHEPSVPAGPVSTGLLHPREISPHPNGISSVNSLPFSGKLLTRTAPPCISAIFFT